MLKKWIRRVSARLGYPLLPVWRLRKLEHSAHLEELFRALQIDCVLDVGANIGQFHEFLRLHVGYQGRIVSFEPIAELHARISEAAGADPKWSTHPFALGDVDAPATINVFAERTLSSFLARDERALGAMGYTKYLRETELARTEAVDVWRLDSIVERILPDPNARVFLKSDTQGYDLAVVRGASGCLDRILALQVELSVKPVYRGAPDYRAALAELEALGFEITGMFPVQRDSRLRVVNFDCVMVNSRAMAQNPL